MGAGCGVAMRPLGVGRGTGQRGSCPQRPEGVGGGRRENLHALHSPREGTFHLERAGGERPGGGRLPAGVALFRFRASQGAWPPRDPHRPEGVTRGTVRFAPGLRLNLGRLPALRTAAGGEAGAGTWAATTPEAEPAPTRLVPPEGALCSEVRSR